MSRFRPVPKKVRVSHFPDAIPTSTQPHKNVKQPEISGPPPCVQMNHPKWAQHLLLEPRNGGQIYRRFRRTVGQFVFLHTRKATKNRRNTVVRSQGPRATVSLWHPSAVPLTHTRTAATTKKKFLLSSAKISFEKLSHFLETRL